MFFSKKYIGLDIGAENIKIAYVSRFGSKYSIDNLQKIDNPLKSTTFDTYEEKRIMANKIRQNLDNNYRNIIMGVPSNHVEFRNLEFNKLKRREVERAAFWKSQEQKSVILNSKDFISDFEIIDKKKDYSYALIAATKKSLIYDYIEIINMLDVNLLAIDVYPLACARVLEKLNVQDIVAIVDIGTLCSLVNIIEKGKVYFCRKILIGGNTITKKIAEELNISIYKAESLKKNPETLKETIKNIVKPLIQEISMEILSFFKIYLRKNKDKKIDSILLIGNGSKLWCLKEILRDFLDVEIILPEELQRNFKLQDNTFSKDIYYDFLNAIGFALR